MATAVVAQSFPPCSTSSSCCRSRTISSRLLSPTVTLPICDFPSSGRKLSSSSQCYRSVQRRNESISLCTNPDCVDVMELSSLLATTRQNCEQFPTVLEDGSVVPVNPVKLRRALRYSTVVVALYVETRETDAELVGRSPEKLEGRRWMPQLPIQKSLIAFGRATSDYTLTASIYDLVVAPSYQRSGYGRRVLLKIVRELRRRGISDIVATSSPEFRPFFQHCGFAPDTLESVTMMYTRGASSSTESWRIKENGRKPLLIPLPLRVLQLKAKEAVISATGAESCSA
ncbi:unnamed protein product [Calypogeia fissa]